MNYYYNFSSYLAAQLNWSNNKKLQSSLPTKIKKER